MSSAYQNQPSRFEFSGSNVVLVTMPCAAGGTPVIMVVWLGYVTVGVTPMTPEADAPEFNKASQMRNRQIEATRFRHISRRQSVDRNQQHRYRPPQERTREVLPTTRGALGKRIDVERALRMLQPDGAGDRRVTSPQQRRQRFVAKRRLVSAPTQNHPGRFK